MRYLLLLCFFVPMVSAFCQQVAKIPEEKILFFQSNIEGSKGNLFMMEAEGSAKLQIGRSGSRPDHYPNWSGKTQKITFESYRKGGWRIWIMDNDGNNARRLKNDGYGTQNYEFDPSFNADGTKVIFTSKGDLYEIHVTTGQINQLTNTAGIWESQPSVSVNDEIVYVAGDKTGSIIYKLSTMGESPTPLTSKKHIDMAPAWSPKGDKILFYSDREGGFEMYMMNGDGSNVQRLLSDSTLAKHGILKGKYLKLDEGWNVCLQYRASFSGDGQWIAFSADTKESREIFITSFDGSIIKQLTRNKVHDGFPVFCSGEE